MKRRRNGLGEPANCEGEERETIEQLRSGLDRVDDLYPVDIPNLEWFQQMTLAEKRKLRRKWVRDLALFWLVAVAVLCVYLTVFQQLPIAYIAIVQIVAAVLPTVVLIKKRRGIGDDPRGQ